MEQRRTFERVADLYAEVRPGYPAALFDDLGRLAALGPSSRILEIGCGAGQATGDLAARAGRVVALDPGERLVAAARQRTAAPNVEFVVSTFEDFAVAPGSFEVLASAQAWHWVDPKVAFGKAAGALVDAGFLAVFGHVPMPVEEPFLSAFRLAFDVHAPGVWGQPPPQAAYLPTGPFPRMFVDSGLFGPVTHRGYDWSWDLDPETFGRYLRTDSSYHFLPEEPRFALFDALASVVKDHGGVLRAPWETHLYIARKRQT